MTEKAIVNLDNITFRWPGDSVDTLVIESLSVLKNEHTFIRGDSGSGKTTLLNLLSGIHLATTGSITVLGKHLEMLSLQQRDQFRGEHLGVIFQQFNLLPFLSVKENIILPSGFSRNRIKKVDDTDEEVKRLLQGLGLPSKIENKSVAELSVGQQQRVAACRALFGAPPLIIADEPTSALDQKNRDLFLALLFEQANKHNSTVIFVSHDQHTPTHFSRIVELSDFNHSLAS